MLKELFDQWLLITLLFDLLETQDSEGLEITDNNSRLQSEQGLLMHVIPHFLPPHFIHLRAKYI